MIKKLFFILMMTIALLFPAMSGTPLFAYDPLAPACTGVTESPNCPDQTTNNPLTGKDGILLKVAKVIAIIAGVAAIIVIIVSGFSYILAAGDVQKAKKARDALIGALVGLLVIALASAIITYVIKKSGVT